MVDQKNKTIEELRNEIVERKGREGKLKEELAEAEGRHKVREAIRTGNEKPVNNSLSSAAKYNTRGKDKPENGRTIGTVSSDWEFRRRQGAKETPFTAGCKVFVGKAIKADTVYQSSFAKGHFECPNCGEHLEK